MQISSLVSESSAGNTKSLEHCLGMRGTVFNWLSSYLTGRSFSVSTAYFESDEIGIPYPRSIISHLLLNIIFLITPILMTHSYSYLFLLIPLTQSMTSSNASLTTLSLQDCDHAKTLGVILDADLKFPNHVSDASINAFYQLRNISNIRCFLPHSDSEKPVQAFISSRLHDTVVSFLQDLQRR